MWPYRSLLRFPTVHSICYNGRTRGAALSPTATVALLRNMGRRHFVFPHGSYPVSDSGSKGERSS